MEARHLSCTFRTVLSSIWMPQSFGDKNDTIFLEVDCHPVVAAEHP